MAEIVQGSARATAKYLRISPRKVRIVVDLIRGKGAEEALAILAFTPKAASPEVAKVLKSAVANAENNFEMDRSLLYVAETFVDQGPTLKRGHPRYRGQYFGILKRSSHITIVVREREG